MTERPNALLVALVFSILLAAPLAAEGQRAEKIARLGFLYFGPAETLEEHAKRPATRAFWSAMKDLGWVDGKNMVAERRYGESADQLHAAAAELMRLKVDVVVVPSCGLATIVQGETRAIPIVVVTCGFDMVTAGLAASLARPGGNMTGSQVLQADLIGKRLQLLKELVPTLSRVATLAETVTTGAMSTTAGKPFSDAEDVAARTLGIAVDRFAVARPEDLSAAFRGMREKGDRGLLVYGSPFAFAHRKQIADLAATHRIAIILDDKVYLDAGGLMSYGPSFLAMWRRAAAYVDKILKGAKPADLPVEQPTKFELVINLKTAKALGLTIPPSVLGRADEIIQ